MKIRIQSDGYGRTAYAYTARWESWSASGKDTKEALAQLEKSLREERAFAAKALKMLPMVRRRLLKKRKASR